MARDRAEDRHRLGHDRAVDPRGIDLHLPTGAVPVRELAEGDLHDEVRLDGVAVAQPGRLAGGAEPHRAAVEEPLRDRPLEDVSLAGVVHEQVALGGHAERARRRRR